MKLMILEADILKAIAGQKKLGTKMEQEHHRIALSILRKWEQEGDVRVAVRLFNALTESIPRIANDFAQWVADLEVFDWQKEEKKWLAKVSVTKITDAAKEKAKTPWYEFTKPKDVVIFDDIAVIMKALASVDQRAKKKKEKDIIHPGLTSAIRVAIDTFKKEEVKAA